MEGNDGVVLMGSGWVVVVELVEVVVVVLEV